MLKHGFWEPPWTCEAYELIYRRSLATSLTCGECPINVVSRRCRGGYRKGARKTICVLWCHTVKGAQHPGTQQGVQ